MYVGTFASIGFGMAMAGFSFSIKSVLNKLDAKNVEVKKSQVDKFKNKFELNDFEKDKLNNILNDPRYDNLKGKFDKVVSDIRSGTLSDVEASVRELKNSLTSQGWMILHLISSLLVLILNQDILLLRCLKLNFVMRMGVSCQYLLKDILIVFQVYQNRNGLISINFFYL